MSIIYVHLHTDHPDADCTDRWFRDATEEHGLAQAKLRIKGLQTAFLQRNPESNPPIYKVACYAEEDFQELPASLMLTMPGLMFSRLVSNMAAGTVDTDSMLGRKVNKPYSTCGGSPDCGG